MVRIFKVGGAIRDQLLNIVSQDTDYVVVGATPEYMLKHGFIPVGRHFPVFIHPKTKEEYALARTEQKNGVGYHGFTFFTSPDITLEQDLQRRDITINAIAEDENGNLIDPFNGIGDIKHKIIRHISKSFVEDPLRVLRVARFKAKLNFDIAKETLELMQQICNNNELEHLSKERIWNEFKKALDSNWPIEFFNVLNHVGAFNHILTQFKTVANDAKLCKKIEHDLLEANKLELSLEEKFTIIIANIELNHPILAEEIVVTTKLGQHYQELGQLITKNLSVLMNLPNLSSRDTLELIKKLDPIRRSKRFNQLCNILPIVISNLTEITSYIRFIKNVATRFKDIDYKQFDTAHDQNAIKSINNKKLEIIHNTHQQFFGK